MGPLLLSSVSVWPGAVMPRAIIVIKGRIIVGKLVWVCMG